MGGYALLGGRFTTIKGLLSNILEQVETNPMLAGDSATTEQREKLNLFKASLKDMIAGARLPFSILLDDPAGN